MKAQGSYESIIRGVSQQVPHRRLEGQHTEQVNLISDPVNGLSRRHGSIMQAEYQLPSKIYAHIDKYLADTESYKSFEYASGGSRYVLLFRTKEPPLFSVYALPPIIAYNRTAKSFMAVASNPADPGMAFINNYGIAAMTAIGKYVFFTPNNYLCTGTSVNRWLAADSYGSAVVWIRGGAFSRSFKVTVTNINDQKLTFLFSTPGSSYPGGLDTSDIVASDAAYTKKVNDRVNAYNSAVTTWIGTSTAAIQPEQIAATMVAQGVPTYMLPMTMTRQGSHIIMTGVKAVTVDDGGDGTLIRGVADEIENVDKVSVIHKVGKVVKVRTRNSSEAFYLKAVAKDKTITSGFTEVTWVEGAGVENTITGGIFYGVALGNTFNIASTATYLTGLIAGPHPEHVPSTAGDDDSASKPFFLGRQITYLGSFQNRLLIGCGGVLACSKTEDYLNFYRSTVLTLPASDAFEMQAQGSEDDELRYSVVYNKDLIVFGTRRQYLISGRVALTPTAANMAVLSQYQDVADSPPIAAGGFIFYSKRGELYSSLHQIQPAANNDSAESYLASTQVDSYLSGNTSELASLANPTMIFMRTAGKRNSVFTFAYLDTPEGRKQDSWSRWDFNAALGPVIGQCAVPEGLLIFTLRSMGTVSGQGAGVGVVADLCPIRAGLSSLPYLDSQRPYASVASGTGSITLSSGVEFAGAYNATSIRKFTGSYLPAIATLISAYPTETGLVVGAVQTAYVTVTNPYQKDSQGQVILSGRLTITNMLVAFKNTSGFNYTITANSVSIGYSYNGRVLGDTTNIIGVEPVTSGSKMIAIGRETGGYLLELKARKWMPFNLTSLEWTGQFFNRTQRF